MGLSLWSGARRRARDRLDLRQPRHKPNIRSAQACAGKRVVVHRLGGGGEGQGIISVLYQEHDRDSVQSGSTSLHCW